MDKSRGGWIVCGCYLIVCKVVYGLKWSCIFVVVVFVVALIFTFTRHNIFHCPSSVYNF